MQTTESSALAQTKERSRTTSERSQIFNPCCDQPRTGFGHSTRDTFLVSAEGTATASRRTNRTVPTARLSILLLPLQASSEKSLQKKFTSLNTPEHSVFAVPVADICRVLHSQNQQVHVRQTLLDSSSSGMLISHLNKTRK